MIIGKIRFIYITFEHIEEKLLENVAYYNDEVNIIFFSLDSTTFGPKQPVPKVVFQWRLFLLMSIFVFDQKKSGLDVPSSIMWYVRYDGAPLW